MNLRFYREYGGKEVDIVLEDYQKNYKTLEIKTSQTKTQDVFPLPHTFETVTATDYFEKIRKVLPD